VLVWFVLWELRVDQPLVPIRLFADRAFAVDNAVLFLICICFIPLFFFASLYAQVGLGDTASTAGLLLLVFFGGFTIAAQWGGRILDRRGARPTVVFGTALGAVGFYLWASKLPALDFSKQWVFLALAGAGMGMTLGPVSTDALNRSHSAAYGAVTGVTQTVRNFAGSLGLAVLGSILVTETTSKVVRTLRREGVPHRIAVQIAHEVSGASGTGSSGSHHSGRGVSAAAIHAVRVDFASATKVVVIGMAAAMAVAFVVAFLGMRRDSTVEPVAAEPAVDSVSSAPAGSR
jgi:MFS family permease